ncbi:MAG: tRNA guanosine(34) transglycosylase Tgt [Bdellovibrionota bacterium]
MGDDFFQIAARDPACRARTGRMRFLRGEVPTPCFAPVGTYGTVKAMTPEEVEACGASLILANTYHLYLRPGAGTIESLGGLHRFMHWEKPILTDSGGFQVYSLATFRKISEQGVLFRSHLDGSEHLLTPEGVIGIQRQLGSDIAMVLDECPAADAPREYLEKSLDLTTRWAERSLKNRQEKPERIFGIIQGGVDVELRRRHASQIGALPFDGLAIGGLGVGETPEKFAETLAGMADALDPQRPHYLMGLGRPEDILEAVTHGVDLFDCVLPTRNARNGQAFTRRGPLAIKNAEHAQSDKPLEEGCGCYACQYYSRAYLRHLYMAGEILSARLLTTHNIYFYEAVMREIREAIAEGRFLGYKKALLESLQGGR